MLSQTVVVPSWRAAPPEVFLTRFATEGPVTGLTVFPFELASLIFLGITTYTAAKHHRPVRLWAAATACLAGTFALLLLYFVPADSALLDPAFPPGEVASALTTWNAVNWVRTGLALAGAALAGIARLRSDVPGDHQAYPGSS
ncbi:anthrone oxygenase family protein [Amycolatopsis kentuckyensis]|uniref:anthrone oxygenase family protein n=1 Tax=Amycolatopsis kentuckyensis TaxID=218823 RepID=UPI00356959A9